LEFSWIVARRQRFIGCELLQTGDDCFDKRPLFHASVGAFFVGTGLAIGLLFMGSAAKQARYLDGRRAKLEWRRNRSTGQSAGMGWQNRWSAAPASLGLVFVPDR